MDVATSPPGLPELPEVPEIPEIPEIAGGPGPRAEPPPGPTPAAAGPSAVARSLQRVAGLPGSLVRTIRRLAASLPESRADRALVLATLTAIILVGAATVAVMRSNPVEDLSFDAPTLVASEFTTTTVAETTTTTAGPAAPAPESKPIAPPPPRAVEPIVQIGEIQIPRIGLVHPVFEGVTLTVINHGPGHWPGSARPGQLGNAVFAGHRTTYSKPFRNLDQLVPGDEIIFTTNDGVFTYHATGQEIVTPKDVHIVNPTPDATLTLFACHPPGSARQRIVVRAALVSVTRA